MTGSHACAQSCCKSCNLAAIAGVVQMTYSSGVSPGKSCTQVYQHGAAAIVLGDTAPTASGVVGNGGLVQAAY